MTDRPAPPFGGQPTEILPTLESAQALEAVPGYVLMRFLGEGTIARAYECRHERSGDVVVLKVLNKEAASDRSMVQRTLRESRVISGLRSNPHIARVIDVGEAPAGPYVAFERLKGVDLRSVLVAQGRLPVAEALAAVRDASRALEAASAVGVAHRDIKPSNLFRIAAAGEASGPASGDGVKLADFGFAAPLVKLGGPPGVYGTPAFIAPELLRGAPADVRTDIYALGATLFQLVTARPLFEGNTADVLAAHQKKPVPSIATMVPDAGIAVVDVIYRLLQKDPARRPQTAAEVTALLEEAMGKRRTSSSTGMVGVGGDGRGARAPAPSEPQWPTMAWSGGDKPVAAATLPPSQGKSTAPASPFDAPAEDAAYVAQPTGVLGTLKQMSVTDILQMLEIGKKSARLELQVDTGAGPASGVVQVHDGQIVFATLGPPLGKQVLGEEAVVVLCRKKEGYFRIHYDKEKCERNVTRPTQFVLLEAMRQLDEVASLEDAQTRPSAASSAAIQPTPAKVPGPASGWTEPPPLARHDGAGEASTVTGSGPNPFHRLPPTIGDGIDRDDATREVGLLDDPTMPAAPTAKTLRNAELQRAMARAKTMAVRSWGQLVDVAIDGWRRAIRAWRQLDRSLAPLRPTLARVHPRLGEVPPAAVGAAALAALLLAVLGLGSLLGGGGGSLDYQDGLEAIMDGNAADVVAALEDVAPAERSLGQDLVLGHAHAALGQGERALELYRVALPLRADGFALAVLAGRLDASAPDEEIDLLVLWPDDEADELLALLTVDPHRRVRANATAILIERDGLGRVDVEHSALLDFVQTDNCGERRIALATLRVAGKSPATLEAVDRVGRAHESCFAGTELRNAFAAIKKRIAG